MTATEIAGFAGAGLAGAAYGIRSVAAGSASVVPALMLCTGDVSGTLVTRRGPSTHTHDGAVSRGIRQHQHDGDRLQHCWRGIYPVWPQGVVMPRDDPAFGAAG